MFYESKKKYISLTVIQMTKFGIVRNIFVLAFAYNVTNCKLLFDGCCVHCRISISPWLKDVALERVDVPPLLVVLCDILLVNFYHN